MKMRLKVLLLLCGLLLSCQPPAALMQAQTGARYFPQTGKSLSGRFLEYWNTHGGLEQQGYPISDPHTERSEIDGKVRTVQYFERAVFEAHPENSPPYDVLLSLLGSFSYRERYPAGAGGQSANLAPGSVLFSETGKRLGGSFLDYWRAHGGLQQQGYPVSDEFVEASPLDGKQYRVQYFERAVFELHPENAGTRYEVLLSQLGTLRWHAQQEQQGEQGQPGLQPTPSAGGLPAVPAGVPGSMSLGLLNGNSADLPFAGSVPLDYRYQYLAGGVGTGRGWDTWASPAGSYVTDYINESTARNLRSVFVYYQIVQSSPEYDAFANLNSPTIMHAYFDDFKLLMQKIAAASPTGRVLVNIEPDLNGVMQQRAIAGGKGDDASTQRASVSSSGQADAQGYPDTFAGYYAALAHIRDLYAPGVLLGLDVSQWAAGDDVTTALRDNPAYDWSAHALKTANYLNGLGTPRQFELLFYSPLDRDAGFYQAQQNSNRWWDDNDVTQPTFATMGAWLGDIVSITGRRVMLWQVPAGNRVYRSENNTPWHWQDNRAEYFLNPSNGRAHMAEWAALGAVGIMWGAGEGTQSHYYDAAGDGVTNPSPVGGNTVVSSYPDDDGGYLRLRIPAYYSSPLALPGAVK